MLKVVYTATKYARSIAGRKQVQIIDIVTKPVIPQHATWMGGIVLCEELMTH